MTRPFWEFQTVTVGEIAPETKDGAQPMRAKTMWIAAPGHRHSWVSREGQSAEVLVFHFTAIEPELADFVRQQGGMLAIHLDTDAISQLQTWHARAHPEYRRPHALSHLKIRPILDGLTLMALERAGFKAKPVIEDLDQERVEAALYWYERNLPFDPSVREAAEAIGTSEVHLRRLFAKVKGTSPKRAFQTILFRYADSLLQETSLTLDSIADHCGYSNASSFSRAYKAAFGRAPGEARVGGMPDASQDEDVS